MAAIDPYQIATMGQNLISTKTLASNGILIDVVIEQLAPAIIPLGGASYDESKEKKEVDRKKITVTVTIGGQKYVESVIVEDKPNLTIDDVDVKYLENEEKPKVRISFDL